MDLIQIKRINLEVPILLNIIWLHDHTAVYKIHFPLGNHLTFKPPHPASCPHSWIYVDIVFHTNELESLQLKQNKIQCHFGHKYRTKSHPTKMKSVTIPQAPPLMMWKHPRVLQPKILPKSDNDLFPRWSAEGSLQKNHQKLGAVGGEEDHYCFHLHIYTLIGNSLDKQHYPPTPTPYTHTHTELSPGERGLGEGCRGCQSK